MVRDLEYDGTPRFSRGRKLSEEETESLVSHKLALPRPTAEDRDGNTTSLFQGLAKTFLKGESLKKGLSQMDPGMFIPIEEGAKQVIVSAKRMDKTASLDGTIIPYPLYQRAVDVLADNHWRMRLAFVNTDDIPASSEAVTTHTYETFYSKNGFDPLSAFLEGQGSAGSMLSAYINNIFHSPGHQSYEIEQAAKGVFSGQMAIGMVFLLELGLTALEIINMFREKNKLTPEIENRLREIEKDPEQRRVVLNDAGFNYEALVQNQELRDSTNIVRYSQEYIESGKATEGKAVTFDHWIAYAFLSMNQNVLRAAVDTADYYSKEFSDITNRRVADLASDAKGIISNELKSRPQSRISNALASHLTKVNVVSSSMYDDMYSAFVYQLDDRTMCCLIRLFGSQDTELIRTIAMILRLVAQDLSAHLTTFKNIFWKIISNLLTSSIYDISSRLDRLNEKIISKILEAIDRAIDLDGTFAQCTGFTTLIYAIVRAQDLLVQKVQVLLSDLLGMVQDLGLPDAGAWSISADRRHLIGMARALEILASKIEVANVCDQSNENSVRIEPVLREAKDQAAYEIIHTILDGSPPSIQIPDEEVKKFFPGLSNRVSPRFGFNYGFGVAKGDDLSKVNENIRSICDRELSDEEVDRASEVLKDSLAEAFQNGTTR